MKIIIFWGTGGIIKWALKHAKIKGYEVKAFITNASKIQDKEIIIIQGNISDYDSVKNAISGKDTVIWCNVFQ